MPESTLDITTAVAAGDPDAFARFYDGWFDRVYAEARRTTRRDESFCLDVTQDVFMRVIRKLKPISSEPALARWMQLVVRTTAYDRLRRDARARLREHARAGTVGDAATATELTEIAEQLQWVEGVLASADAGTLDLLLMRHRFGWTLERIGAAIGLGPGAVDGRLRRALDRLREAAREEES